MTDAKSISDAVALLPELRQGLQNAESGDSPCYVPEEDLRIIIAALEAVKDMRNEVLEEAALHFEAMGDKDTGTVMVSFDLAAVALRALKTKET